MRDLAECVDRQYAEGLSAEYQGYNKSLRPVQLSSACIHLWRKPVILSQLALLRIDCYCMKHPPGLFGTTDVTA